MEQNREEMSRESRIQAEIARLKEEGVWKKDAYNSVTVALFDKDGTFVRFLSYDRMGTSSRSGGPDDEESSPLDEELMKHPGFSFREVH